MCNICSEKTVHAFHTFADSNVFISGSNDDQICNNNAAGTNKTKKVKNIAVTEAHHFCSKAQDPKTEIHWSKTKYLCRLTILCCPINSIHLPANG